MEKLERVLASGVLRVLRERAHVALAPTRTDALCDELEVVIAPTVEALRSLPVLTSAARARRAGGPHHEVLSEVAQRVADRLCDSDHVDDIFASDQVIRRDTVRVLEQLIGHFHRGMLEVESTEQESTLVLPLLTLGYLVGEVSKRLEIGMLRDALERAVATVDGRLLRLTRRREATFEIPGRAESRRLELEEAVTHELAMLIEAELVELPHVEQVLELTSVNCLDQLFEEALERCVMRTRTEYDCDAQMVVVDQSTVIATLTPLSAHAADHADEAFARLLTILEQELAEPTRMPESHRRGGADAVGAEEATNSSRPTSSRRKRKDDKAPPRSQPRGKRRAPRAATSSTRQMREAKKRKRAK